MLCWRRFHRLVFSSSGLRPSCVDTFATTCLACRPESFSTMVKISGMSVLSSDMSSTNQSCGVFTRWCPVCHRGAFYSGPKLSRTNIYVYITPTPIYITSPAAGFAVMSWRCGRQDGFVLSFSVCCLFVCCLSKTGRFCYMARSLLSLAGRCRFSLPASLSAAR